MTEKTDKTDIDILVERYTKSEGFRERLGFKGNLKCEPLARGEYNINYLLTSDESEDKLVLRVNTGSQMHLEDQIMYEYGALKILEDTGCTPKAIMADDSRELIPYGVLVMEYLPGKPLDYRNDLKEAALILSRIHSHELSGDENLIKAGRTVLEILKESDTMFRVYENSVYCDKELKDHVRRALDEMISIYEDEEVYDGNLSVINTELNSGNFLINKGEKSYLIDWEKPLIGDPMQDIAHFLAPTTTFWKTDVILDDEMKESFLKEYSAHRNISEEDRERLEKLIKVTCFRGITWCAMAYTEYMDPGRQIKNKDTFEKIKAYLKPEFYKKYI